MQNKSEKVEHFERIEGSKASQYEQMLPVIEALVRNESDPIANMANIAAVLKQQFNWLWVGFYRVSDAELVLGPFQGPLACTRIPKGKGVCGKAWAERKTLLVDDVFSFPGHIACNPLSKSEIVVPLFKYEAVWGVLDIDSSKPADFEETDRIYLDKLAVIIGRTL